jgi:hypothetical protein
MVQADAAEPEGSGTSGPSFALQAAGMHLRLQVSFSASLFFAHHCPTLSDLNQIHQNIPWTVSWTCLEAEQLLPPFGTIHPA